MQSRMIEPVVNGAEFRQKVEDCGLDPHSAAIMLNKSWRTIYRWYKKGIPKNHWELFLVKLKER